jgi:hypothetical protein
MADTHICETCNEEFPTSRGLNIHNSRVHGAEKSEPNIDITAAKEKYSALLGKARPSALLNIPLRGMARTYHDPSICLSPQEASDLDGVIQDVLSEIGGNAASLEKIVPLMPWLALFFIGGPIILDKLDKIQAARAGNAAGAPPPAPRVADGSAPTLTRKDVMADA